MAPLAPTVGTVELELQHDEQECRGNSTGEIQEQIFRVPKNILHAAPEYPQEPHVAQRCAEIRRG